MKLSLQALVGAAVVVASVDAGAENKTLPGSACIASDGRGEYSTWGHFAADGGKVPAYCPIVRDDDTDRIDGVWVRPKAGDTFACQLASASFSSNFYDSTEKRENEPGESIRLDGDDLSNYSGGSYWVNCDLVDDDAVASIRWSEPSLGGSPDVKVTPGVSCSHLAFDSFGTFRHWDGSYFNPGPHARFMTCPLYHNQDEGGFAKVEVRALGSNNATVSCAVYTHDDGSNFYDQTDSQQTTVVGMQTLGFDMDIQQFAGGSAAVRCRVDPAAHVRSIRSRQ